MTKEKIPGISRIDSGNTHGWFTRKYHQGQIYSRFFSDSRYQDSMAALAAAREYRAKLDEKFPAPATAFRNAPQKNSSTGVVGVSETFMRSRSGQKIPCFTVTWRATKGVSRAKKFSILAYGRDEAFRRAVEFRRQKEAELLNPPSVSD